MATKHRKIFKIQQQDTEILQQILDSLKYVVLNSLNEFIATTGQKNTSKFEEENVDCSKFLRIISRSSLYKLLKFVERQIYLLRDYICFVVWNFS